MKIRFIGLGNLGAKLAGSLLRNDFDVTVRDLDRETAQPLLNAGAHWADSGREMAENCDVVITCLPSPEVSAKVMEEGDGVIAGLSAGKVWLEMSTTDEDEVKRLGEKVGAKGAIAMDTPVSGGCHRAARRPRANHRSSRMEGRPQAAAADRGAAAAPRLRARVGW